MAQETCTRTPDRAAKEQNPHGSLDFPCGAYALHYREQDGTIIPWHWHEELEIVSVVQGQMKIQTSAGSFLLEKGELLILNSNILHYGAAVKECRLHSLVFSPRLITGSPDSAFTRKYIAPLLSCSAFSACRIGAGDSKDVSAWFQPAFEAMQSKSFGFEFSVRENLSHILLFCCQKFESYMDTKAPVPKPDHLRIKKMLDYIHSHFSEDLSLKEISQAADISQRECLRCFQKTIQLSPIQYLLKYRIMQGAKMLLDSPSSSISEIAISCGFDSPSNFSKVFRRFYSCPPREYRRKHRI